MLQGKLHARGGSGGQGSTEYLHSEGLPMQANGSNTPISPSQKDFFMAAGNISNSAAVTSTSGGGGVGGLVEHQIGAAYASGIIAGAPGDSSSTNSNNGVVEPHTSSTSWDDDVKFSMQTVDDKCWSMFLYTNFALLSLILFTVYQLWEVPVGLVKVHSVEYFLFCVLGGIFSGLPHTLITPLDLVKCRVQVGEYAGYRDGFHGLRSESATKPNFFLSLGVYYRGWVPTFAGYSLQGAFKFGFYEYFKWKYAGMLSYEFVLEHKLLIFFAASASAEFLADIALAPWEAVKVKVQTNKQFPPVMRIVIPRIWSIEGLRGFYKGLAPLWCRQIPYTMVKFACFEKTVEFIYSYILRVESKNEVAYFTQLLVSLLAGYLAGTLCAIVSHPADTIVSKLNQKGGGGGAAMMTTSHNRNSGEPDLLGPNPSLPSSVHPISPLLSSPNVSSGGSSAWALIRDLSWAEIWKGIGLRIAMIGTLTGMQWLIYDGFKIMVGLPTTGSGGGAHQRR